MVTNLIRNILMPTTSTVRIVWESMPLNVFLMEVNRVPDSVPLRKLLNSA